MEENLFILSDGNKLCYVEYGNPHGIPVFLFHGNPGARISWGLYPESPYLKNIRIIAPDRPAHGIMHYKRDALEKWPGDSWELSEYLGIKKFHLFAPSGGRPYALACAWKIPLDEILVKITIWQADEDCLTGIMAEYFHGPPPNSELINVPDAAHLWIMEHIRTVLAKLVLEKNLKHRLNSN